MSNFFAHVGHLIPYPSWDLSYSLLSKRPQAGKIYLYCKCFGKFHTAHAATEAMHLASLTFFNKHIPRVESILFDSDVSNDISFGIGGWQYSVLPIYRGYIFPNNKRPISRPLGREMGVCRAFQASPKFYIWSSCAVCSIMSYRTAIYRESKMFLDE